MELERMALLEPDSTKTPSPPLKAMVLPAPAAVPPIVLLAAPLLMRTPLLELPRSAVPLTSVPM